MTQELREKEMLAISTKISLRRLYDLFRVAIGSPDVNIKSHQAQRQPLIPPIMEAESLFLLLERH